MIGDGIAVVGAAVTFWGAQWSKSNTLSGGSASASFKGFADKTAASRRRETTGSRVSPRGIFEMVWPTQPAASQPRSIC